MAEAVFPPLPKNRGRLDPADEFREWRLEAGLNRVESLGGYGTWLATKYSISRFVLTSSSFSVKMPSGGLPHVGKAGRLVGDMLAADPPQHAHLRRAHAALFSPRRIGELRNDVQRIVARYVDELARTVPPVDLCSAFATPVAESISAELILGLSDSQTEELNAVVQRVATPGLPEEERIPARSALLRFSKSVLESRKHLPGPDLLSALVSNGELSDEELLGATDLLIRSGHHDMARTICFAVLVLLAEGPRWTAVGVSPLSSTVEELLRYTAVFQLAPRTALEEVCVEGALVRKGDVVLVSLPAANRDPERFASPDHFDPSRDASGHLTFGSGRHICLGQHLVRVEMEAALAGLRTRFPRLRLAVPLEAIAMFAADDPVYGVTSMPVMW